MSDDYKPCQLRKAADSSVTVPTREICYALIDTDSDGVIRIINVYSPGTAWTKALAGARNLECGYAQVICDVTFQVLPLYKIYRANEDLTLSTNNIQKTKADPPDFSKFTEADLDPLATRKFVANNATTFLGLKIDDMIWKVFSRGTGIEPISAAALTMGGDIVIVKAKAEYTVTHKIKVEKTSEQLKYN